MGCLVEGIGSRKRPADKMGGREGPVDVISCRGARPTRWVAGGVRRIPENQHQDLEVVREKVKGSITPAECGKIHNAIER